MGDLRLGRHFTSKLTFTTPPVHPEDVMRCSGLRAEHLMILILGRGIHPGEMASLEDICEVH